MATLGEQAVGSIVKLNVGGVATNFIVVHQGLPDATLYDASCDGTWILMQDIYIKSQHGNRITYDGCTIDNYLNNEFVGLLDGDIQGVLKNAKIPYSTRSRNSITVYDGENGLSRYVFLLSAAEIGIAESTTIPAEGAVIDYFNGLSNDGKIANYSGTPTVWYLRSPYGYSTNGYFLTINANGVASYVAFSTAQGVRPAMVLPYNLNVSDSGLVDGTVASTGAIIGQVNIGGVQRELTGAGYININGVLRDLSDSQVNIGGTLRSTKG